MQCCDCTLLRSALCRVGLLVFTLLFVSASAEPANVPLVAVPLAAKSGPKGATLFTPMRPQQTGVITRNAYNDPKMWGEHYREFAFGSIGTGVAIGDYDNDGRPDLFVVSKTSQCRLFRNLGGWKFEDVTDAAGLTLGIGGWLAGVKSWVSDDPMETCLEYWQQGATFADVNNDGWLDLYICRFNAPNLLYINQHDGTFKEEAAARGLAVVDACGMAAFCDYDRDGWLDVYVQTSMRDADKAPNGGRGYLFHNNGDGTFTNVTDRAGIRGNALAHSATWWDFDGDGWPDLYIADDFSGPDYLYRNNHDGTFSNVIDQVVPHTPFASMGADLGDVNNDGRIDFFVADMAATTHEKDHRGMARSRDLSHTDETPGLPQYSRNALYVNTGTGHMLEAANLAGLAATDWTWSVRLEDLDNDGRLDLHVTNGMVREFQNADVLRRLMSCDSMAERARIWHAKPMLRERHLAFRNLGDLRFENVSAAWGLDQVGVSYGAAFGDLDGDGDLDLVYANCESGVAMLRNDCETGHRLVIALRGTRSNRFGIGATVRIETDSGPQVRQLVLARGYFSSSEPIVHFGLGNDAWVNRLTVEWPSGEVQSFTHIAADQHFTITEPTDGAVLNPPRRAAAGQPGGVSPTAQFVEVGTKFGLALDAREDEAMEIHQPLLARRFDRAGPSLDVGDLDASGRFALILGGTSGQPPRILRPGPSGRFESRPATAVTAAAPYGPALVFDADGDGRDDLLLTKTGDAFAAGASEYQPELLLNRGDGDFQPAAADALPSLPISVGAVAAADFNRDGRVDVFVGGRVLPGKYPLSPRSALLVNRGGHFEDVTAALAPKLGEVGMVTAALWSDVDGDGWPDLLIALDMGTVKYFHNDRGRGFTDWSERAGFAAAGTGWWSSLASADFNEDGRPDYVVGNLGLNTRYRASPEHPSLVYYGDFAGSGKPVMIEAHYEGDRLYPRRTKHELRQVIPWIPHRYARTDMYARATLEEILGHDRLLAARSFATTELRSGVFLSRPDGTYQFEPLPNIVQIAPLQGIVTGDFDGDGHADIYAVQNSYAVPSVGHFDGGLSQLLRGDGHGRFIPVEPATSGLVVPGDAKALVLADLNGDGWPDFVMTRNNATMLAFQNRGVAGRHSIEVVLRGPRGNMNAIGARVELELANGAREWSEITAGSGYYSQSAPACFFGYADGNPPARVRVRWPDGASTVQRVPRGAALVSVGK